MDVDIKELRGQLERRRAVLKDVQNIWLPHWKELRQFIQPFRGRFEGERPNQHSPDMSKQIISIAMKARRTLSSGMQAGLTSPSRDWFRLTTEDPDLGKFHRTREWCDELHRRMMLILPGSGFYHATHSIYDELSSFGTGAMIDEAEFKNVIRYKTLTIGSYYAGLDQMDNVNVFYRDLWMTAAQIVKEFGKENCSTDVLNSLSQQPDKMFEVRHAIEPDDHSTRWAFRSVYWEKSGLSDKMLRISGYNSFPVQVARWEVIDGDTYGYGPGSEALGDVKSVMKQASSRLTAINKQVEPPLQALAAMRGSSVKTTPNGITYVDDIKTAIAPLYNVNISLGDLKEIISETKADINSAMYVDLFMMLNGSDNPQMTAREIIERHEEKMTLLGPVLERLTSELHTPSIERLFAVMSEKGLVPTPPEELAGKELKIEYISVLAQAQKMMGLKPLEQLLSFVGNLSAVAPEALDNIDTDQAVHTYGELVGAQTKVLRDPDLVEKIRQKRQDDALKKEQMEQMSQMAQSGQQAAQGAKVLSEIDTGPDNALAALLGAGS